jgi:hypothetical protein
MRGTRPHGQATLQAWLEMKEAANRGGLLLNNRHQWRRCSPAMMMASAPTIMMTSTAVMAPAMTAAVAVATPYEDD